MQVANSYDIHEKAFKQIKFAHMSIQFKVQSRMQINMQMFSKDIGFS